MGKPARKPNRDILHEITEWVATGGEQSLSVEAQEVMRRLLANNRDRLEIFRHVQAHRSVERLSKLNILMDQVDRALFMPERIEAMSTKDLIATKRLLLQQEEQDMELVSDVAGEGTPSIPEGAAKVDEDSIDPSGIPPARRQVLVNTLEALMSSLVKHNGKKRKKRKRKD